MEKETKYICDCGKSFETQKKLSHHKTQCKIFQQNKKLKEQKDREKRRLPNGMFKCENPNCRKEHDGSYGSGRFCSLHCRKSFIAKKVKNRKSGFAKYAQKNRSPYGTWKCCHCGIIFETKSQLQKHIRSNHAKYDENGKRMIWNKGLKYKDHPSLRKARNTLVDGYKSGRLCASNKGKKHTKEEIQKIRIGTFAYFQKINGISQPRYNINSISFFDKLSKEKGWNLQHAKNGGEITVLGYWLDAYDKQRNIVVEYDERFHYIDIENNVLREKDIERQNEIIEYLHCEFWRYNEAMDVLWKVN